ncbi:hypothetical protein HEK616_84140 (plasmid) [Streptomyces nigrescens]|uniref:Lasso RiPP family leader peptide-containing protein n=1 Tax=Streptomyces nigrescens TaxID=1920 RepID=A0ABM8A862_STRNI|nr:hypothetical protein [Streptomyces nigrescens]BDM74927.1 hypothetical protein HEK616_84140 [Streptomyces nigrescens]
MRIRRNTAQAETVETGEGAVTGTGPAIALPEGFSVEAATLGRQPHNDGDNSGAMWFE